MFQDKSEDELIKIIKDSGCRVGVYNADLESAKVELNKRLLYSLDNLNKSTTRYLKWLIGLTTTALGCLVIVQIIVTIL